MEPLVVVVGILVALLIWQRIDASFDRHERSNEVREAFGIVQGFLKECKEVRLDLRNDLKDIAGEYRSMSTKLIHMIEDQYSRVMAVDLKDFSRARTAMRMQEDGEKRTDAMVESLAGAQAAAEPAPEEDPIAPHSFTTGIDEGKE